jgi:hypothetical protein
VRPAGDDRWAAAKAMPTLPSDRVFIEKGTSVPVMQGLALADAKRHMIGPALGV